MAGLFRTEGGLLSRPVLVVFLQDHTLYYSQQSMVSVTNSITFLPHRVIEQKKKLEQGMIRSRPKKSHHLMTMDTS